MEFDLHPLGSKADQRIRATLLPVQVTYDAVSLITDDCGSSTFVIPSGVSFSFLPKGEGGGGGGGGQAKAKGKQMLLSPPERNSAYSESP